MAEQPTYEFVEVKAADIMADRTRTWAGFNVFLTWSTGLSIAALVLLYLIWG